MSSDGKSVVAAPATATAATAAAAPVTVTAEAVYANSNTRDRKQQEWTDVQFKTVVFPSQPKRSFRVTVQRHEEVTLVVEDNQTHEKWTCVIEHPSKHGPDMSMPNEAFIAALETSIKQLDTTPASEEPVANVSTTPQAEVVADMVSVADAMNLTLRMHISVFWEPEYTFHMAQVGLKTVDLLAAQLRDVQEELHVYKEKERLRLASHLHLVCNDNKKAPNGYLQWMCSTLIKERAFTLTDDSITIVINNDGLYHIEALVNCSPSQSSSSNSINLHVNKSIGGSVAIPNYGGLPILSRTTYLKAGDQLSISTAAILHEQQTFTISLIA